MNFLKGKRYCIVSKWCYPFGGGEEFLYQTMEWAFNNGMECYWLTFTKNNKPFEELIIENVGNYGKIIKIPDGLTSQTLYNWLKLLKPDIVHHQGHERLLFYEVCEMLRIEFLSGFHFWTGGIILDPICFNTDILKNYAKHKTDPQLTNLIKKKYCNLYTVTPFVSECIEKITEYKIYDNIFAASSQSKCKIPNININENIYVSIINIHKMKGGELLLYLLKELPNIPFLGVKTEFMSEELDEKIEQAIKINPLSQIINRVSDPSEIYKQTRIFLAPSIVDETFCRTVNEAMMNGIPVLTTGYGNLKYLVDNDKYVIPFEDKEKWKNTILDLYNNPNSLKEASSYCLKKYEDFSENKAIMQFTNIITKTIKKSKENNIMLFTPWCDQGLGIQSQNYYNTLKDNNYNVMVFAIKPYGANSCIQLQKNPEEWFADKIYYSSNDREKVSDIEIIEFVKRYNVGKCLLPETCWFRVFEIAKLLRSLNVKCFAIPNIEIVRKDEIFKHKYFYKILANNYLCKNTFENYGFKNVKYMGYGINNIKSKLKTINDKIKYLFIGGMNAFSRKHILEVCEGFLKAYENNKNIELTCTIQKTNLLEINDKQNILQYLDHPAINIIQEHLSYKNIIKLYYNHHIVVQVSKHEGLGLGFYESLATGTPVITLNTPPHNEIIINEVNGWLIDCYYKKMIDNTNSLFDSAYFNSDILCNLINSITIEKLKNIIKTLYIDNEKRINHFIFEERLVSLIN
jgi:glycosyltransferase involved in cell wall biosynthesis